MRSIRSRNMKGLDMPFALTFSMALVLFAAVFLFVVFTNSGEYFYDLQEMFLNLFNTTKEDQQDNYKIAKASFTAAACAMRSVASGSPYTAGDCSGYYSKGDPNKPYDVAEGIPTDIYGFSSTDGTGSIVSKDVRDFMTGLATSKSKKPSAQFVCNNIDIDSPWEEAQIPLVANGESASRVCSDVCYGATCESQVRPRKYIGAIDVEPSGKAISCDCKIETTKEGVVTKLEDCPYNTALTREQLFLLLRLYLPPFLREPNVGWTKKVILTDCVDTNLVEDSHYYKHLDQRSTIYKAEYSKCKCKLNYANGQSDEYSVYAVDDNSAAATCRADMDATSRFAEELKTDKIMTTGSEQTLDYEYTVISSETSECERLTGDLWFYEDEESDSQKSGYWSDYVCEQRSSSKQVECSVYNFNLPQDIKNPKETILKYGDPEYLVYWQSFPIEQVTWAYDLDWKVEAAIILLGAIPISKIPGAMSRTIGKVAIKKYFPNAFKAFSLKLLPKDTKGWLGKQFALDLARGMATRIRHHPFRVMIRGVVFFSATQADDIAQEQAKSMIEKFEPESNSLVLKSPYKDKETSDLGLSAKESPVIVQYKDDNIDIAHFVSPCNIESMKIGKEALKCETFVYNGVEGTLACENLKKEGSLSKKIKGILGVNDPVCDLKTYLGSYNMYIGDIETIKKTPILDVIKDIREEFIIWEPADEPTDPKLSEQIAGSYLNIRPFNDKLYGWKKLDCTEWRERILEILYAPVQNIGKSVKADDGTEWYFWGCPTSTCKDGSNWIHSRWTNEDICGENDQIVKFTYPLLGSAKVWGKCEKGHNDEDALILWSDNRALNPPFKDGQYLLDSCLSYKPQEVPERIMVVSGPRMMMLSDTNDDGYFDSYTLHDCKANSIYISSVKKASDDEYNYCFDERGIGIKVLEYGGIAIGTAGIIVGGALSGPPAWIAAITGIIIGTGFEVASVWEEWNGHWPGKKAS